MDPENRAPADGETDAPAPLERPTSISYENRRPMLKRQRAQLRVVAGREVGAACEIGLDPVRVGAAAENHLVLADEKVSRRHLELQICDLGYRVRDLGSTNGTFYRGARIQEALIGPGAEIRLGSTVLRLEPGGERSDIIQGQATFGGLVGSSRAMQEVYGILAVAAPTDLTVLIQGETGTGKELVAEELHQHSLRSQRPFVVVDCGSLPPNLIESELFGHERGAFTGAVGERAGAFEEASGGTVFLDEIGELPLELQTRLLRVLDKHEAKRVGGNRLRPVDVRVVAATNCDLSADVRAGRFRQDLYYRLAVVRLVLPPLRKRREDIPALARHFLLQTGCGDPDRELTNEVLQVLSSRKWPGNVRELRNFLERAVLLTDGAVSAADAVAELSVTEKNPPTGSEPAAWTAGWLARAMPAGYLDRPYKAAKDLIVHQFEALYLGRMVERHGGNISRIAKDASVDRVLVRRLLRKHGFKDQGE